MRIPSRLEENYKPQIEGIDVLHDWKLKNVLKWPVNDSILFGRSNSFEACWTLT